MADQETTTLEDLGEALGEGTPADEPIVREPKIDAQGRAYATGKRKNAVARVWIKPGAGRVTVNGREFEKYFAPSGTFAYDEPSGIHLGSFTLRKSEDAVEQLLGCSCHKRRIAG